MAYAFDNASSRYLSAVPAVGIDGTPMTLACWVYPTAVQNDRACIAVSDGATTHRNAIQHNVLFNTTPQVGALAAGSLGLANMLDLVSYGAETPVNTWSHVCGVFASSTSRTIYVGGISKKTNTTDIGSQNIMDEYLVGARRNTTISLFYTGNIADAAIWNATLTADEIASLAKGMTCDKVRPQNLVAYFPLCRDLIEYSGGLTVTNNNTATVADHPRVYA